LFFVGVLKASDENSRGADPDPCQNVMDPQHWQKHLIFCSPDLRAMELVNLANLEETPDNCVEATEHESEELFEDACEVVEEGSASSSASTCGFAACAPLAGLPDLVPEGESEFSSFAKF
jgi:hypothetical protein